MFTVLQIGKTFKESLTCNLKAPSSLSVWTVASGTDSCNTLRWGQASAGSSSAPHPGGWGGVGKCWLGVNDTSEDVHGKCLEVNSLLLHRYLLLPLKGSGTGTGLGLG